MSPAHAHDNIRSRYRAKPPLDHARPAAGRSPLRSAGFGRRPRSRSWPCSPGAGDRGQRLRVRRAQHDRAAPSEVSDPQSLYQIRYGPRMTGSNLTTSYPAFQDLRRRNTSFSDMIAVWQYSEARLGSSDAGPRRHRRRRVLYLLRPAGGAAPARKALPRGGRSRPQLGAVRRLERRPLAARCSAAIRASSGRRSGSASSRSR